MKTNSLYTIGIMLVFSLFLAVSCEEGELSEEEVSQGLKEALIVGTDTSVTTASNEDGYYKHKEISIPFPEEAEVVKEVVSALPGGSVLIDELVLKINRAAEDAAIEAQPIFEEAVNGITFEDAFQILMGKDNEATNYLNEKTSLQLYDLFRPKVVNSLSSVGAQQAWEEVMTRYNSVPLVEEVNTDLADYSTNKALDGLFFLVEDEEKKIRTDIKHRVTETLKKVFAEQDDD